MLFVFIVNPIFIIIKILTKRMKQGTRFLLVCLLSSILFSCENKTNIQVIGSLQEGFRIAKNDNKKVLLIVSVSGCGKCDKYIEFLSRDNDIRNSLEKDFVIVYEKDSKKKIGAKLTRCFATPMPYLFDKDGRLIAFGYPKENKTFSDTLNVGMDNMGYLELFNLSISQADYKKMVSKSMQAYLCLSDTTSKADDFKIAYQGIKESININPYCYNLHLANLLAKQIGYPQKKAQEFLLKMKNIVRPVDRHIYDDILKEHFNLTKEDVQNIIVEEKEFLKLSTKEIDLGKIERKAKCDFSFDISNKDKVPVIVRTIRASCSCVEMYIPKAPILPNKSSTVKGIFDAKNKGKFSRVLYIHTNSQNSPLRTVVLKGTVI